MTARSLTIATGVLLLISGCREDVTHYREVKRIHEKVTEKEMQQFLAVVGELPDGKLPELAVYRPLPNWNPRRTLPVGELVKEEQKLLERGWDVEWHEGQLKRNRHLVRALSKHKLTLQQFIGLTLAIGAAVSRSALRDDQEPEQYVSKGKQNISDLMKDERTFAKLSREDRFNVHRKAGWLTRSDRATRLLDVPPENIILVRKHSEKLAEIFPQEFRINPLDGIADLLAERGMPFEELDSSGRDADLTWDRSKAKIKHDDPDPVVQP